MRAIYVHLSPQRLPVNEKIDCNAYTFSSLPDYARVSMQQTNKYLGGNCDLIDDEYINDCFTSEIKDFFELCKKGFPSFYKNPFWLTTLMRLYIAQLFCTKNNIQKFIHLEYDNLIYSDFKELNCLPGSVYFTRVGPMYGSAGFVYCNDNLHFENFIKKIKNILDKGEIFLRKFTQDPNLSEMTMIDLIYQHTEGIMDFLPILPEGIGSENFEKLQSVFDGASYGQFIGGTNAGDEKGWYGLHHYIGQSIHNRKTFPYFDSKENKPYLIYKQKRIPILNLHVHSKKLLEFI